ncbi:MAG: PASTA domain-containing protein [Ruthenibacterium sp.]
MLSAGKKINKLGLLAGVAGMILVGCGIAVFTLLYSFLFDSASDVEMPNFYGMEAQKIKNDATFSKFDIEYTDVYTNSKPMGVVVGQTPRAPRNVKSNAHIVLSVSAGLQQVTVPDLSGMTRDAAKDVMKKASLNLMYKPITDNTVTADTVLHTVPAAGEKANAGDTVTVFISRDQNLSVITVPDCVGKASLVEAIRALAAVRLSYELAEGSGEDGAVTAQEPAANEHVPLGTTVKLTLNGAGATGLDTLPQMQITGADGHTHEYEPTSVVASNAYSIGYTIFTCKVCGYFYYGDFTQPGT